MNQLGQTTIFFETLHEAYAVPTKGFAEPWMYWFFCGEPCPGGTKEFLMSFFFFFFVRQLIFVSKPPRVGPSNFKISVVPYWTYISISSP